MPRIQMTPMVKFALYFLRVYLVFLLVLIVFAFIKGLPVPGAPPPSTQPATAPASSAAR